MKKYITALSVLCLACSCRSISSTEQTADYRTMARITERMDSMIHATATWQQSLYEKQTSLVDSFRHSEVHDTSRAIFLGATGDTIKETIVIKEHIEREHTSQQLQQELREEIQKQTDSIIQVNKSLQEKMDSVLHAHEKDTVVERQAPWHERLLDGVGRCLIFFVAGLLIGRRYLCRQTG